MKKIIALFMATLIMIGMCACRQQAAIPDMEPQISQMKAICELATMECYYHNVAKFKQEDATGYWFWTKDKHFWIEYSGIVTVGIDVSQVKIEISGTVVTITLPEAQVLGCEPDPESLSKASFIVAKDSAPIKADDETIAISEAQEKMRKDAENNKTLLANAQLKAKELLEEYINNVGDVIGKEYTIKWEYLDTNAERALIDLPSQEDSIVEADNPVE